MSPLNKLLETDNLGWLSVLFWDRTFKLLKGYTFRHPYLARIRYIQGLQGHFHVLSMLCLIYFHMLDFQKITNDIYGSVKH